jgi:DNA-binding PadR family transcriptional regulator
MLMHKELLLLGLLQFGPKTGYDLHRFIQAHGDLYTDLQKGNIYYLLDRLATKGFVSVVTESGARGNRGERLIYTLTDSGREHFLEMLRDNLSTFELAHTGVEVGMFFLSHLPVEEAIDLLKERRQKVFDRRTLVNDSAQSSGHLHVSLAQDHLLMLMDAELAWIDRTLQRLRPETGLPHAQDNAIRCPGPS